MEATDGVSDIPATVGLVWFCAGGELPPPPPLHPPQAINITASMQRPRNVVTVLGCLFLLPRATNNLEIMILRFLLCRASAGAPFLGAMLSLAYSPSRPAVGRTVRDKLKEYIIEILKSYNSAVKKTEATSRMMIEVEVTVSFRESEWL